MALVTVEGTYRDGKVELAEQPEGLEGARVIVTFLDTNGASAGSGDSREAVKQRVIARMRHGINLGGPPYPTREEIYEERLRKFDR